LAEAAKSLFVFDGMKVIFERLPEFCRGILQDASRFVDGALGGGAAGSAAGSGSGSAKASGRAAALARKTGSRAAGLALLVLLLHHLSQEGHFLGAGFGLLFLAVMSLLFAWSSYSFTKSTPEAIVFAPTITVKSSPDDKSTDLFVVHEGTKVRIIDNISGWYEIRIANGSVGWLPLTALEKI